MKLLLSLLVLLSLSFAHHTHAFTCTTDADCCLGATCIFTRATPQTLQCVLPTDALCPPCDFGFHYSRGVCVQDSDPCASRPCLRNETCVYEPKNCITTPCPQYRCDPCRPPTNPCLDNPCKRDEVCIFEPKQCIRAPCPQYSCVPACSFGYHLDSRTGTCVPDSDPCSSNPCPYGQVCQYEPKVCVRAPCPQYSCTKQCVICPLFVPFCPSCPPHQECAVTPQTCDRCASAKCYPVPDPKNCVSCIKSIPTCTYGRYNKPGCPDSHTCVVFPQTCKRCAFAKCVYDSRVADELSDDSD